MSNRSHDACHHNSLIARIWSFNLTEADEAAMPRRPPPLRDDDPIFRGTHDRLDDDAYFRENEKVEFRLISASAGDRGRAGLDPPPVGYRTVYLSRCNSWDRTASQSVCFHWPIAKTSQLNRASDDRLFDIYEAALDEQIDREDAARGSRC